MNKETQLGVKLTKKDALFLATNAVFQQHQAQLAFNVTIKIADYLSMCAVQSTKVLLAIGNQ
jgi:hypothetical protein